MDEPYVRAATSVDLRAVEECVEAAYSVYLERMTTRPAPMLADYAALIDARRVFVLNHDGIRAVIVLEPRPDCLFVENVAVHPAYQGQGLGRTMMQFAEAEARRLDLPEIQLYTNQLMTENLDFYLRLGFEIIDRRQEGPYLRVYFRKQID